MRTHTHPDTKKYTHRHAETHTIRHRAIHTHTHSDTDTPKHTHTDTHHTRTAVGDVLKGPGEAGGGGGLRRQDGVCVPPRPVCLWERSLRETPRTPTPSSPVTPQAQGEGLPTVLLSGKRRKLMSTGNRRPSWGSRGRRPRPGHHWGSLGPFLFLLFVLIARAYSRLHSGSLLALGGPGVWRRGGPAPSLLPEAPSQRHFPNHSLIRPRPAARRLGTESSRPANPSQAPGPTLCLPACAPTRAPVTPGEKSVGPGSPRGKLSSGAQPQHPRHLLSTVTQGQDLFCPGNRAEVSHQDLPLRRDVNTNKAGVSKGAGVSLSPAQAPRSPPGRLCSPRPAHPRSGQHFPSPGPAAPRPRSATVGTQGLS
ncbi:translation initiation factor IF-2-like [Sorex araneus]|uniref:translation initiation factor IF-2-like n=1 Tax=Sorex araneus TaxID=42254 RepID=UPI002433B9B8|nr:translation initiation factor IF-2-like [Sorex araneus]